MNKFSLKIHGQEVDSAESLQLLSEEIAQRDEIQQILGFLFSGKKSLEVRTSGSTGEPATIRLTRELILQSAKRSGEYFGFSKGQKVLLCLPLDKIGGIMLLIRAAVFHQELISVEPKINLRKSALGENYFFVSMIPLQVSKLLSLGLKQLPFEKILVGGAGLSQTLLEKIELQTSEFFHSYGLTETASHIAMRRLNGKNASKVFTALKGVTLSQTASGTLLIELVNSRLKIETTDLVDLISDSKFTYLGRLDNVINASGYKISPENIEERIRELIARFGIKEFFSRELIVYGEEDSEEKTRLVLRIEGEPVDTKLLEILKDHLNPIERPVRIEYVSKLPRTANGKIVRA